MAPGRVCHFATNLNSEARGLEPEAMIEGVTGGNMDLEGEWTLAADQVLVF
jgi:hypothetical protein